MTRPVQVTFRNVAVSAVLEQEVRERAAWLETFYSGIVGCRVLLEFPHRHQSHGRPVHVRVELSLPGEDIIVNQEGTPHLAARDPRLEIVYEAAVREGGHEDVIVAIHDAFDVARRRLEDYARRHRADVKTHQPKPASVS